jgi:rubrerythrin
MAYLMDPREIVEFAVYIEKSGYEFYVKSMKKFADAKVIALFQYLADEEFKHENLFKKILSSMTPVTGGDAEGEEYGAYMREFCKAHLLANPEKAKALVEGIHNEKEALALALQFEKDSVIFFTELKALYTDDKNGSIDRVIQEEMVHIRRSFLLQQGLQAD